MNGGRSSVRLAAVWMMGAGLVAAAGGALGCDVGTGAVQSGGRGPLAGARQEVTKFEGRWRMDGDRTAAEVMRSNKGEFNRRDLAAAFDQMVLTLRPDGTTELRTPEAVTNAKWFVEGKTLMIVTRTAAGDVIERGRLLDDGTLELTVTDDSPLKLSRVWMRRDAGRAAPAAWRGEGQRPPAFGGTRPATGPRYAGGPS
jgi:hypothetical protein